MRVHYFSAEPWEEVYVRTQLVGHEVEFHQGTIAENADLNDPLAEALCVFIDSNIGAPELARFPKAKFIATRSTGFDHVDLSACKERGAVVANVPFYGENTVAEFAFALILALSRRVVEARDYVKKTGTFSLEHLRGFDLAGKTLGVVGCGHIGRNAVRIGRGFGMKILCFDVQEDAAFAREQQFSYVPLEQLLAASDIITLHVPYNEHTHHLINRDNVGTIKKGAYLINTARGAIVETEALILGLHENILAGVGLDVLEEEGRMNKTEELALLTAPHPSENAIRAVLADRYLIDHPRVIVTPHMAFDTKEAVRRITDTTIQNLLAFAAGAPVNTVSS